ncbi:MAG TPA: pyruvate ferredoxin oxidoreductase [Syntrophaceae bacterium]|jgi:pyruvate ferredoxin oxidoreductase gamma subunit/2-oxoisovalerate ferredoxin oxidoreductase gamma subunit|nr:pyruvate ferredoxin oxidoreductase [Syntrophaceae bacterium]
MLVEIRFHGRGGQGTVVATILLAKAFFRAGYQVQSFPFFGVERRGAPVEAYVRLDKEKILLRTNVYYPDHVVVQDQTLLPGVNITRGLKPGGWVLINSTTPPADRKQFIGYQLALVDANRIALKNQLGTRTHPIVNTAMIGAFARMTGMPPLEAIRDVIREEVPDTYMQNIAAAEDAYTDVQLIGLIESTESQFPDMARK